MSDEDNGSSVKEAPMDAIQYAATAIRSGFRKIPRSERPCDYLGNYMAMSSWSDGSAWCSVHLHFHAKPVYDEHASGTYRALTASGVLFCHDGVWNEAKLALTLVDETSWSLHHHVVDGKTVIEVAVAQSAGSTKD